MVNSLTTLKGITLLVMIIGGIRRVPDPSRYQLFAGLCNFKEKNLENFAPYGASGVLAGAAAAFFGFVGFDEVTCFGEEIVNPSRNMPLAIVLTMISVTLIYFLCSFALVGMMPSEQLSINSGFYEAFKDLGQNTLAEVSLSYFLLQFEFGWRLLQ